MKTCKHCESIAPNNYEKCPKCGKSLKDATEIELKDGSKKKTLLEKSGEEVVHSPYVGAEIYDFNDLVDSEN